MPAPTHLNTARLSTALRRRPGAGARLLLVHGNASDSRFFAPLLEHLPAEYDVAAPDLRGYGGTEARPVDARRGLGDFADDLLALMDALGWADAHVLGHSLGGGVALQLTLAAPGRVRSLTLVAPLSPYGFGGTVGEDGAPNAPDFAGSGAGVVNPAFVAAIEAGDRGDAPGSPRDVMRRMYWAATPEGVDEEELLSALLATRTGDDFYPGDWVPSPHWPGTAPGERGVANAMSPKHLRTADFAALSGAPPVLWVRGDADAIVSDASLLDPAHLGALGILPGWPGHPAQPMVAQTRAVLRRSGALRREHVMPGVGHSPFLERPGEFVAALREHLEAG